MPLSFYAKVQELLVHETPVMLPACDMPLLVAFSHKRMPAMSSHPGSMAKPLNTKDIQVALTPDALWPAVDAATL